MFLKEVKIAGCGYFIYYERVIFILYFEKYIRFEIFMQIADNGADKLTTSHITLFGTSQAFSSIELPGMLPHRREIDT